MPAAMSPSPKSKCLAAALTGSIAGILGAFAWQSLHGGADGHHHTAHPLSPRTAAPGLESGGLSDQWAALLRQNSGSLAGQLAQAELVARAGSGDMPKLLELAAGNRAARELLLRRWAMTDPQAAAAWLTSTGAMKKIDGVFGLDEVQTVYCVWAQKDPAAAMASLQARSDLNLRRLWSGSVLEKLLDEDMAAGVKFGALTGSGMSLSKVHYRGASPEWVKKDPARAVALLTAEAPGEFRNAYLGEAIDAMAATDLPAAVALLRKHQKEVDGWVPEELFSRWARQDSAALDAFLDHEAAPGQKPAIRSALAREMSEKDPVAALRWSSENLDSGSREQVQSGILTKLAQSDPAAASTWLDSLSEGTALRGAVDRFTEALPDSSPEALLANAKTLPEGAARRLLTAKAYEKWYQSDPDNLLTSLAAQPSTTLPEGIWAQLGRNTTSTEDGLKRAAALPPEVMPEYLKAVFQHNIQWHEITKFTAAMAEVTEPAMRAAAIEGAMQNLTWLDPSPVAVWARTLPENERRLVANQLTARLPNLSAQQQKELIDPLK